MKLLRTLLVCSLAVGASSVVIGCAGTKNTNVAVTQWKSARSSVMLTLAKEQFNNNDLDGARKSITDALALIPESAELRIFSARIAIEQGHLELAENELIKASAADPKNAAADYYRGTLMQRWQRTQRALELYASAWEKNPKELAYVLAQAEALVTLDRESDALTLLKTAQSTGSFENSGELRAMQGQVLMRQKRYAEACVHFREASLLSPEEAGIREQLARALYSAEKKADAMPILERLVADEVFAKRADLHTQLGECYLAANRPQDAKASFETASALQPANLGYTLNLAKSALDVGDLRRAEMTIRRALALAPTDGQANLLMGFVRMEQKKYEDAVASFRRAAAADTKDSTAAVMSGIALEKLGKKSQALEQYARALTIDSGDPLARERLANLEATASLDDR